MNSRALSTHDAWSSAASGHVAEGCYRMIFPRQNWSIIFFETAIAQPSDHRLTMGWSEHEHSLGSQHHNLERQACVFIHHNNSRYPESMPHVWDIISKQRQQGNDTD